MSLLGFSSRQSVGSHTTRGRGQLAWLPLLIVAAIVAAPAAAQAEILGLEQVATGLDSPTYVTHAPGDANRLFITQRGGAIRILDLTTGLLEPTPFLSIPGVLTDGEGGLLGLAFHPEYQSNGRFYAYLTADDANAATPFSSYVREYTVSANPNIANVAFTPVLNVEQPQNNHNGGWIGFSPNDDNLYIMLGDGGASNDTGTGHTAGTGNAQDITDNWLGKTLRIDVDGDDFPADVARNYAIPPANPFVGVTGDDEIWASGLRNPYRASFDRATGDLWIGDVGQSAREEVDFQPAASDGGENYGWRLREGSIATPSGGVGGPAPPGAIEPVYDYPRTGAFGGSTVIGGYIYRGPDPDLQGLYFFADSGSFGDPATNKFWTFDPANPAGTVADIKPLLTPDTGSPAYPTSFGEDASGNLYIVFLETNQVYRIVTDIPEPASLAIVAAGIAGALGLRSRKSSGGHQRFAPTAAMRDTTRTTHGLRQASPKWSVPPTVVELR